MDPAPSPETPPEAPARPAPQEPRARFLALLRSSVRDGSLTKLTLGRHRGEDHTLKNIFVRPVMLSSGPHLSFVWRHATRDVTKNHAPGAGIKLVDRLLGTDFLDAHLFTATQIAQLECEPGGRARLRVKAAPAAPAATGSHDHAKAHSIAADAPWLCGLGVTDEKGNPLKGMAPKFRQIQKFAELVSHLLTESGIGPEEPLSVVDMGCGKGYLTFAVSALLGERASVVGVEARAELVESSNRMAVEQGFAPRLSFVAGTIAEAPLDKADLVIALHACDTATDDALARGIAAGSRLLLVSPCCQKELRPQLTAPPVLALALRHGIFQERHAEFVTDALRAQLLEWAGYRTKVFEFVSPDHTARNLMIAVVRVREPGDEVIAGRIREFAAFYGIRTQALARLLGFTL